jgi:hypothetical protein
MSPSPSTCACVDRINEIGAPGLAPIKRFGYIES